MNKTYKVENRFEIPGNQYVLIAYRDKQSEELFYIGDDKTYFTNNVDEAFFCKREDSEKILSKFNEQESLISKILVNSGYSLYDLLWIITDVYRVVGYMQDNDGEYHLSIANTLNMINTTLHKEKRSHKNGDIDLVIEKYFPETDEWYNIETGLTHDEELISKDLVSVVNRFTQLPQHHPCHHSDMCNAVHVVQRLLQSRTCHRLYPDKWILYPKKKGDDK